MTPVTPPPLRIEVPNAAHATSLQRALESFGVETEALDGCYLVQVDLVDRNPNSRVVDALDVIDRWLLSGDLPFVRVHLNGRLYTVSSPLEQRETPASTDRRPLL